MLFPEASEAAELDFVNFTAITRTGLKELPDEARHKTQQTKIFRVSFLVWARHGRSLLIAFIILRQRVSVTAVILCSEGFKLEWNTYHETLFQCIELHEQCELTSKPLYPPNELNPEDVNVPVEEPDEEPAPVNAPDVACALLREIDKAELQILSDLRDAVAGFT